MNRDWAAVATAVKERRLELGLRQKDLADRADMDPSTIRNLEKQARDNFDDLTLSKVSKALGWPPLWLDAISRGERPDPDEQGAAGRSGRYDELTPEEKARVDGYIDAIIADRSRREP